jgi:hypothetical protein
MGLDQGSRNLSGRSLVPLLRGEAGENSLVYAEVNVPDWSSRRCVIMDGWKYIEGSTDDSLSHPAPSAVEVFNLNQDPGEKQRSSDPDLDRNLKNLMGETKNRLNQLRKTLNFGRSDPSTLSPEMVEVLRQQGYL